nr:cation:proton antiporter [uncultured Sphaerochaeta sp.]
MIAVLRKLIIISILFAIILFIQSIQVETTSLVSPKTLAVLGFLILASFTLGEILSTIGLPRVIGYLLIGIIFGPYTTFLFNTDLLKVFDFSVIKDLSLVNAITLSIIALTAGMELKLGELKKSVKPISLILLFKTIFIFLFIPLTVFAVSSFIPFLQNADWRTILASGLLLSVIAMGTSIELTLVVASEAKAEGRYIDIILSTSIVKDVLVILLLALCLTISISLLNPAMGMELNVFTDLGLELLFSVLLGLFLGIMVLLYLKYIAKELLLFIFAFIVVSSAVSSSLHLETLIVFITTGFLIRNYSEFGDKFHHPLNKLSLPIFITFFTVAGASINLLSIQATIIIGIIIAIIRAAAMYLSVRFAAKMSGESKDIIDHGWMGFLSIGGLMLGLGIIIEDKIPGFGTELKTIITSIVALNLFLGPILLKFALGKIKNVKDTEEEKTDIVEEKHESVLLKDNIAVKFKEPDLSDQILNKSLFQIVLKLNNILRDFDKKFIVERSEESLELIISITEKYTDDYIAIKSNYLGENVSLDELRNGIFEIKRNLDKWYLEFCSERKAVERNVLKLEPLIKELFFSLTDLTDSLHREVVVNLEKEKYELKESDSSRVKLRKYLYSLKFNLNRLFNKEYKLTRKIDYKNLAKYFLVGESYNEILETVNLVGLERLTTLRKIRNLFNDYSNYLSELAKLTLAEESNPELISTIQDKYEELHRMFVNELNIYRSEITNTTEEISSRLTFALANPYNRFLETLYIAGTPEFKSNKYKYSKIFSESEIKKDKALETIRYWINYYLGFIGLFEKEIYINKLETELNLIVDNSLIHLSEDISRSLRLAGKEISAKLSEFKQVVNETSDYDADKYLLLLKNKKEELLNNTVQKFINNLEEIRRGKKMNRLIENMIHDFSTISASFPKSVSLLEDKDFKFLHRTPEFKNLKTVPIHDILSSFLEKKTSQINGRNKRTSAEPSESDINRIKELIRHSKIPYIECGK